MGNWEGSWRTPNSQSPEFYNSTIFWGIWEGSRKKISSPDTWNGVIPWEFVGNVEPVMRDYKFPTSKKHLFHGKLEGELKGLKFLAPVMVFFHGDLVAENWRSRNS